MSINIFLNFRGNPWSISGYLEEDPNKRSIPYLDQYSTERWDTVLHYMVRYILSLLKVNITF